MLSTIDNAVHVTTINEKINNYDWIVFIEILLYITFKNISIVYFIKINVIRLSDK